jgi:hypothetical protein
MPYLIAETRLLVTFRQRVRNVADSRSISATSHFGSCPLIETRRDVCGRRILQSHTTLSEGKVKLETSVWITAFKGNTTPHPTQKPLLLTFLAQRCCETYSEKGGLNFREV